MDTGESSPLSPRNTLLRSTSSSPVTHTSNQSNVNREEEPLLSRHTRADVVAHSNQVQPILADESQRRSFFGPLRLPLIVSPVPSFTWSRKGPRERRLFERFIYCLPDINSFLPSFTSTVDRDLDLKRDYQSKGYGYPARDFNNGYPRPTPIPINQTAEEFRTFLLYLYPRLQGRELQVFRMDRQRRLNQVMSGTPRELKDCNYKGIIVIIPTGVHEPEDTPVDSTSSVEPTLSPSSLPVEELTHPLTSVKHLKYSLMPHTRVTTQPPCVNVSGSDVTSAEQEKIAASEAIGQIRVKAEPMDAETLGIKEVSSASNRFIQDQPNTIKRLASKVKESLGSARTLLVSNANLVEDILGFYRDDPTVVEDDVSVFLQDVVTGHTREINTNLIYTMFWKKACRLYFEGDEGVLPKLSPLMTRDLFNIMGRVLAHGLVLMNYWPIRLSSACSYVILTGREASPDFLVECFKSVVSDTEREVIKDIQKQAIHSEEYDSPANIALAVRALAPYGCTQLPVAEKLPDFLTEMAVQHCQCRPYWSLLQMFTGFSNSVNTTFSEVKESELRSFYDALVPSSSAIMRKITYSFAVDGRSQNFEKTVIGFLDKVLLKLSKEQTRRLLLLWCGSDCLNVDFLLVTFSNASRLSPPCFDRSCNEMTLCRYFPSQEVLYDMLETSLDEGNKLL